MFGAAEFVVHVLDKTIARCVDITGTKTFQNANIHVFNCITHIFFCNYSGIKGKEVGDEKLVAVIDLSNITYKNLDARGLITGFQFLQVIISFFFSLSIM